MPGELPSVAPRAHEAKSFFFFDFGLLGSGIDHECSCVDENGMGDLRIEPYGSLIKPPSRCPTVRLEASH